MKKIVLRNGRTMRCPTFLLCIAGVLLAVGVLAAYTQSKDIDVYTEKDTLVSAYINYLSKASSARAARENMNFLCESPGMGTLPMGSSMIDLDEAEQSGYLFPVAGNDIAAEKKKAEYCASIALQQHDLVVEQFGANAWDNVSYTLKEIEPADGDLGYRVKSTGEFVDKEEYEKILYGYWEAVAAQEGTSYADLFLTEGESAENIASKRVDLIAKYSDAIPVELVTVSDFRTYEVLLSFNGKTISADGYEDFGLCQDRHTIFLEIFSAASKVGALIVLACRYKCKPARSTHIYLNLS